MTGNTSCVTKAWIEAAFPQDHVLIAGYEKAQDPHLKAIALDNKRLLSQLTDTYEFDCIVYFSQYLIPHNEQVGELERLRHVLQINRERPVRILYLAGPESVVTPETGKTIMAKAAEELCRLRNDQSGAGQSAAHAVSLRNGRCGRRTGLCTAV